jgi:hypothetical protein
VCIFSRAWVSFATVADSARSVRRGRADDVARSRGLFGAGGAECRYVSRGGSTANCRAVCRAPGLRRMVEPNEMSLENRRGPLGSLGGSNPSPSADNPNRQQRCGNKQERGGPQARLSHRLKPLRTAMDRRATVAHRRRDPSKGEECVRLASSRARWSTRTNAAQLARSFWRQHAGPARRYDARLAKRPRHHLGDAA